MPIANAARAAAYYIDIRDARDTYDILCCFAMRAERSAMRMRYAYASVLCDNYWLRRRHCRHDIFFFADAAACCCRFFIATLLFYACCVLRAVYAADIVCRRCQRRCSCDSLQMAA